MSLPGTFDVERSSDFLPKDALQLSARLGLAASTGLVTLLIGWLAVALFLAPYWSAQTNFPGHQHPKGTPPHTHSIELCSVTTLWWLRSLPYSSYCRLPSRYCYHPFYGSSAPSPKEPNGSRAPPLF